VSPQFWCEAFSTVVHLNNHLLSQSLNNDSPFFRLFGHKPTYFNLRTFGCTCYVHLPQQDRIKLTSQSIKCVFLGYFAHHKGFVYYDPNLHRLRVSRNVIFQEDTYFFLTNQDTPSSTSTSVLPLFSNNSVRKPTPQPLLVYQRRQAVPPNPPSIPPRPSPDQSLAADQVFHPAPAPVRCNTRVSKPPESMIFLPLYH